MKAIKSGDCSLFAWIFVFALFVVAFGFLNPAQAAFDTSKVVFSFDAEMSYWVQYSKLRGPKAFAIGPSGAYGWAMQYRNQKEANMQALKTCRKGIRVNEKWYRQKIAGDCVIFAEGAKTLLPAPWGKGSWQDAAEGPDMPLSAGKTYLYGGFPPKGIVLFLHGCDGLGSDSYLKIWANYFNAMKFHFFAPNSFADIRPSSICGGSDIALVEQEAEIIRLRIAQTQRNLRELRARFPGLPIYIWGHSEGSAVLKSLVAKVDGIIASGDICDRYFVPLPTPAGVPILFIFGENDPFSTIDKLPLTQKSVARCKKYIGGRKLNAVIVKDAKHDIWPWRPEVSKAISKFITGADIPLPPPAARAAIELPAATKAEMQKYLAAKGHKAFAVHSDGSYSWVNEMDFLIDAENWAVYDCDLFRHTNPFADGKHSCSLQDVDGIASLAKP